MSISFCLCVGAIAPGTAWTGDFYSVSLLLKRANIRHFFSSFFLFCFELDDFCVFEVIFLVFGK